MNFLLYSVIIINIDLGSDEVAFETSIYILHCFILLEDYIFICEHVYWKEQLSVNVES